MKPDQDWRKSAEVALNRAALRARELAERTETPLWVKENGVLVDLLAEVNAKKRAARDAAQVSKVVA